MTSDHLPRVVPPEQRPPLDATGQRELETLLMQVPAELARGLELIRQIARIYGPRGRGGRELADVLATLDLVTLTLDATLPDVMRRIDQGGGGAS